ncbi:MAG TPA: sulfatase-like hydrolase/transferase [Candidatus Limnocylindrales bacterium]|nr:sulfatase-like hydrolase/transferase [Candidatus Limnocylindrales bacterium]
MRVPTARPSAITPVHPPLFGAWFILFLLSQNLDEVSIGDALPVVAIAAVGATIATLAAALILRGMRRGALVAGAATIGFFAYGHVANALQPIGVPGWLQQVGWLALLVVALIVAVKGGDRTLVPVTRGLNVVALVLVVTALATILPHELARPARGVETVAVPGAGTQSGAKRDIWYLIFDRYALASELKKAYGIDNPLPQWLTDHGFYVAADSHANYVKTVLSLASSLNMTYLDDVAKRMGADSDDHGPINDMLHAHALAQFLKPQGYEYVHVGGRFQPTNVNPYADENPTPDTASDFSSAVVDTSVIPALTRRFGITKSTPSRERYYSAGQFQFRVLDSLVERTGKPRLVFAHLLIPHPPYVYAADGSFVPTEDDPHRMAQQYGAMITYLNGRIEALMTKLLALPEDRRPIIVLQADEGPYPARYNANTRTFDWSKATNDELRVKYGIFNSYYLPGVGNSGLYPSITPVNSFRLILSKYFGANLPLLPDRIYTSREKFRPYDMTDVTDRMKQP